MGESWLVLVKGAEVIGWGRAGYVGCLALWSGVTGHGMIWGLVFHCSKGYELLANIRVGDKNGIWQEYEKTGHTDTQSYIETSNQTQCMYVM